MLGVEAVLLQTDASGVDRPVAYFFKKLNRHQQRYSTIEKEALLWIWPMVFSHQSSHLSSHSYNFQITKHSKSQGVFHLLK